MPPPRNSGSTGQFLPLRGVKVLSFELAYSLPAGTRTLAELGAEVVRVGGPSRDNAYVGVVDGVYLSKTCVGIDLKHHDGLAVAKHLVTNADVVCSNFVPGVMERLGLGSEEIARLNPPAIILQLSGYGSPGPWSGYPAFGPSTEAAGGMNQLMGRDPDPPVRVGSGVFSDQLAGRFAALSLLAALERRKRTGEGCYIDLSMAEAISTVIGHTVLAAALGESEQRLGNRDRDFAPQGVYRAAGEDEWVAITVKDDKQWEALVELVGDPGLTGPDLTTVGGRQLKHDTIDAAIEAWTVRFDRHWLAQRLQESGIAAAPVQTSRDPLFDSHLAQRGAFRSVGHERPLLGYAAHPHLATPWGVDGYKRSGLADLRRLGADNVLVLGQWLGMSPDEVHALEATGALIAPAEVPVDDRRSNFRDPDFGTQLGLPTEGGANEGA